MTSQAHEPVRLVSNPQDLSVLESDNQLRRWTRGIYYASNLEEAQLHLCSLVREERALAEAICDTCDRVDEKE